MIPKRFAEANTTHLLDQNAEGADRGELPTLVEQSPNGSKSITSVWEPTDGERALIAAGGSIALRVMGEEQPPVCLYAVEPEGKLNTPVWTEQEGGWKDAAASWLAGTHPKISVHSAQARDLMIAVYAGIAIMASRMMLMPSTPLALKGHLGSIVDEAAVSARRFFKFHKATREQDRD